MVHLHDRVWLQLFVWAQNLMFLGTIVHGHNRMWAQSKSGHKENRRRKIEDIGLENGNDDPF